MPPYGFDYSAGSGRFMGVLGGTPWVEGGGSGYQYAPTMQPAVLPASYQPAMPSGMPQIPVWGYVAIAFVAGALIVYVAMK